MGARTRVELGRRADLGADCANCFGLCCVALAFAESADFPFDKPAGEPCSNLDDQDGCRIHPQLRDHGFKGCTVFECFGAGQKVSQHTFGARSWRADEPTRRAMFGAFPIVRRLQELLWYLDRAIDLVEGKRDLDPWKQQFQRVLALSHLPAERLADVDVDAVHLVVRPLLLEASEVAREVAPRTRGGPDLPRLRPGSDLVGANLVGADLRGRCLRGALLIAADLTGARFAHCDVLGVDLRDAELSAADLTDAIFLSQMQINSARGDSRTRLPAGFLRPAHWAVRQSRPPV